MCAWLWLAPQLSLAQTIVQAAGLTPTTWRAPVQIAASLAAQQSASLALARGGIVASVDFHSGEVVAAGQLLLRLQDGPQAAQLALDQARLGEAARELARTRKLMTISGASQSALEQAIAAQAEAQAQLSLDQAELAQLQLSAPFAGITGIRNTDPGDYLQPGQAVVTLTATGPLRVLFAIPQTEASGLRPGDPFTFTAPTGAGVEISAAGQLTALSPLIDPASNARDVEGRLSSTALLPGMAGMVSIATGTPMPAFAVPSTALTDNTLGPYVFVLTPAAGGRYTLTTVYVSIDGTQGDTSYIAPDGLQPGQKILRIGGAKLDDGASVALP